MSGVILGRLQAWALAALAVLLAIVGAYSAGARKARDAERAKTAAKALNAARARHDTEADIDSTVRSPGAAAERLRDRWSRD